MSEERGMSIEDVLLQDSGIGPPEASAPDMGIGLPEAPEIAPPEPMTDAQLQSLVVDNMQAPDTGPEIAAPEPDTGPDMG